MSTTSYPPILTKENFWNELQEKHPKSMKVFCDWIDEYKKRVNWEYLFDAGHMEFNHAPKFHQIPVAMQIGIFFQFTSEVAGDTGGFLLDNSPIEDGKVVSMEAMIICIQLWFADAERSVS